MYTAYGASHFIPFHAIWSHPSASHRLFQLSTSTPFQLLRLGILLLWRRARRRRGPRRLPCLLDDHPLRHELLILQLHRLFITLPARGHQLPLLVDHLPALRAPAPQVRPHLLARHIVARLRGAVGPAVGAGTRFAVPRFRKTASTAHISDIIVTP